MRTHARLLDTCLTALAGLILFASAGTNAQPFPDIIPLPADFGPEGIAVGNGSTFYAGSLAASTRGQILVGDLRTGEVATLAPPDGVPATGMKYDARSNLLFVARAASGLGTVFDAASGAVVAPIHLSNSAHVRQRRCRDPRGRVLHRHAGAVSLSRGAGTGWEPAVDATQITVPGTFRTNGIAATPNGEHLFIVDGATARLYRLDTATHTPAPCRSRRRHTPERGRTVARRQAAVRRAECP